MSFAKAQIGAGNALPVKGSVAISLADKDKKNLLPSLKKLSKLGFKFYATRGTHDFLGKNGIKSKRVLKVSEGEPNIVNLIEEDKISLLINTPMGEKSRYDAATMRRAAVIHQIPYVTTASGAIAAVEGIEALKKGKLEVRSLQEYYK